MPKAARPVRELGMISHTEMASTDPLVTKRFFEKVFGWEFSTLKTPYGDMYSFRTSGGADGSVRKTAPKEAPMSVNYVLVEDLSASEKAIVKAGGEIVLSRVEVPKMGSFFWFKVPGGPVLACWQDAPERKD